MGPQKPRTGTDLARELAPICLGRPLLEGPGEDLAFVQGGVRTWLAEQGCERGPGSYRPNFVVSDQMRQRALDEFPAWYAARIRKR